MPTITQGPDSVGACLVPEYHPLYSADHDYELQSTPGTRGHEDLSALDLFTVGANMTFGEVGKRWQVGLLGAEVSYVPWASRSLWWVGFVADYSHDRTVERDRLGAGLEGGYGPFGLDFAPLLKVGTVKREESRVGLQARAVISLPTWYTRPDYDRACCPSDSTLRSCACAKSIWTFPLLEPYVSVEIWHNGPEQTVRAFAGVVGKFGYGF